MKIGDQYFRQVFKEVSDGNGAVKILVLQMWEPIEHLGPRRGFWVDIEIELSDNDEPPLEIR